MVAESAAARKARTWPCRKKTKLSSVCGGVAGKRGDGRENRELMVVLMVVELMW